MNTDSVPVVIIHEPSNSTPTLEDGATWEYLTESFEDDYKVTVMVNLNRPVFIRDFFKKKDLERYSRFQSFVRGESVEMVMQSVRMMEIELAHRFKNRKGL